MTTSTTELGLHIQRTIEIDANPQTTFDALLEQIGPANASEHGPMPMVLEAWPGGRWFRDLGNRSGHLWAHVQVIKPPSLLELYGPMFMSYAAINHIQYRITERGTGTLLTLTHRAFGDIEAAHREGVGSGWAHMLDAVKKAAER